MAIRIIYHASDFDGHAGGAIARYYFEYKAGKAYTMHSYNYGNPFPHDEFETGDEIYFIDCSYQPNDEMKEWEEKYGYKIYIIDHHKTVVESDIIDYISGGVLNQKKSGCELAWNYFMPDKKMPKVVQLLGRYDVWDKSDIRKWNSLIEPFQYGFNLVKTNPYFDDAFIGTWCRIFNFNGFEMAEFIDDIVYKGKQIVRYKYNENKRIAKSYAAEMTFHGKPTIVINSPIRNSSIFNAVWDENKYEFMLVWSYTKYGDIGVSLYTTRNDIDLSEIAKIYGGGGHLQAAGFGATEVIIKDGVIEFR